MRVPVTPFRPLLLGAAAALVASGAQAQRVDPNRVYDVILQVNQQVMSATIREGGTFNLTLRQTDEYRLVPVASANGRNVTMAVYRGVAGQPSTSRIVERVELAIGRPATLRTNPNFTLVVDRIRSAPPERQTSMTGQPFSFTAAASWRRAVQSDNCCVCCGEMCACACGVKMSCGSCCMPGCCSINETSGPGGDDEARRYARLATFLGTSPCDRPFGAAATRAVVATR